jgi:hypothetical protein
MTLAFKTRVQDSAIASHRYRVLTPIRFLAARGHAVELYDASRRRRYDTVVFSKAYKAEDRALAKRLRAAGQEVVLDLCDDHFYNPWGLAKYRQVRDDLLQMIALADRVICSTPVLARSVQQHAGLGAAPAVAPDVYEQAAASAAAPTPLDRPARLLWYGRHGSPNAPAGMGDLRLIQAPLARAFGRRLFELTVCSDSRAAFDALAADLPFPTRYVDWSPAGLAAELGGADAVVIPLSDNPFVAAKTHNRLTLALSAGLPVVADPLDAYQEFRQFCWLGDWSGGLEAALLRPDEARARAALARPYLEAHWSEAAIAPLWETALGLQADSPRPVRRPAGALSGIWRWLAGR